MKKLILFLCIAFVSSHTDAQSENSFVEKPPVFPACKNVFSQDLESCFYKEVQRFVYRNFNEPKELVEKKFEGTVLVLFEVSDKGIFKVLYVDALEESLVIESKRVFGLLPTIIPPTYNGKPTYGKYTLRVSIPLQKDEFQRTKNQFLKTKEVNTVLQELDTITYKEFENPQFKSHLNIPFSHSLYAQFDNEMNRIGVNNHTGSKPYSYTEVSNYYDFASENKKVAKGKTSWWGRKLWDENLVEVQGKDYWFTLNPIFDLEAGKSHSNTSKSNFTYVNTRALQFNGGLGNEINFSSTLYESQGRFADYFNRYAESIAPDGGNPAIIPGVGISKRFKTDSYDFPLAEANLSLTPNKFINMNLGYGKNFIGDGYRSLLLGDGASPYPYLKMNTTFWKIKYTNIYTWLKDVRPDVTVDRTYATKFVASHYLSLNVNNRLNLGLFESVVWAKQNNRGFDMSFVNPIIFYRAVEFGSSSRSGNAILGLTSKYKLSNLFNFYGQFLLDEFSMDDMTSGNKSWKNKYGYQIGMKYYNAFGIKNLLLQGEFNHIRPYVYSHSDPITNYGHNNQSLGHNWGGNLEELIGVLRYHKGRYFADAKFTIGKRGFDFDTEENNFNYGGNIYKDYEEGRPYDVGVTVGQGNKTNVFIADLQLGYLINPMTNMKLYGSVIYRDFNPLVNTPISHNETTTWFSIGLRCDIFNWYFDY